MTKSICTRRLISSNLVRNRSFLEGISQKRYELFFFLQKDTYLIMLMCIRRLIVEYLVNFFSFFLSFPSLVVVWLNWQETVENFSSLFFFFFSSFSFFILIGLRKLARDSLKFLGTFFVFLFVLSFLPYLLFTTRRIVPKSDKKYKASLVWLSQMK